MTSPRRSFLKTSAFLAGTVVLGKSSESLATACKNIHSMTGGYSIRLYHSGSLNGRITSSEQYHGGLYEISKLILQQEMTGLIFDAGNFLSPTANRRANEETIMMMNSIGYHTATLGPHEIQQGQQELNAMLKLASFSIVNCNYTFTHPRLKVKIKPYQVIHNGKLKIGITGAGPDLTIEGVTFNDPNTALKRVSRYLKEIKKCDLVICLSHLSAIHEEYNDRTIIESSEHIDFVIGGSPQKLNTGALVLKNLNSMDVILCHSGTEGSLLGKTIFNYDEFSKRIDFEHHYLVAGSPYRKNVLLAGRRLQELSLAWV